MFRERLKQPQPPPEEIHPKIAEAARRVQKEGRDKAVSGMFLILVNVYQGSVTHAEAYRSEERSAFYCGRRIES